MSGLFRRPAFPADLSALAANLASTASAAAGAGKVGYGAAQLYAEGTVGGKLRERVSAFDFMSAAQIADVKSGAATLDVTAAMQMFVAACSSNTMYGAPRGYLPAGRYRITAPLLLTMQYISLEGDGQFASQILLVGAGVSGLKADAGLLYLRPTLQNFAVVGGSTTGHALDFSACSTVYMAAFENLYLDSGNTAFKAGPTTILFSGHGVNVQAGSATGHAFHANLGPSFVWQNCYALWAGPGKAGYRFAGSINMQGCNGVNAPGADYWGVFGNDVASADGFQSDFAVADYPDIMLLGCNVEYWGSLTTAGEGIRVQAAYRSFQFLGGKIDRAQLATNYSAAVHFRAGANGGQAMAVLAPSWMLFGGGTPSLANIYCDLFMTVADSSDQLRANGITTYKVGGLTYQIYRANCADSDLYLGVAAMPNAISPRRLSVQMQRYKTIALTPVGAAQTIDVTGHTKAIVTPAAAASVSKAVFTATAGADLDYGRNGELVIEAANANLTLIHTARGGAADSFILTGGANLALAAGQIARFLRSETGNQWQQV